LLGTKAAGHTFSTITKRTKKALQLIRQYNRQVANLPANDSNPQKLPEKIAKDFLMRDSQLWDLERFRCNDRWAKELKTRRTISLLQEWVRGEEELHVLACECQRFLRSQCQRLENVQRTLLSVPRFSRVESILVEIGAKSEQALQLLQMKSIADMVSSLIKTRGKKDESFERLQGI
jgi:hypothetical protein